MDWHERYVAMKEGMGYDNNDIAEITGNSPESIRIVTGRNKELPRWVKLSIVVFEELTNKNKQNG